MMDKEPKQETVEDHARILSSFWCKKCQDIEHEQTRQHGEDCIYGSALRRLRAYGAEREAAGRAAGWSQYVCALCKCSVPENIPCPFCRAEAAERRVRKLEDVLEAHEPNHPLLESQRDE